MKIVEYKGEKYKCEVTVVTKDAIRIRVYDSNNVGNLYIWTKGYDSPRPYKYNTSKLIVKNVVMLAFKELMKKDKTTPSVKRTSPVIKNVVPPITDTLDAADNDPDVVDIVKDFDANNAIVEAPIPNRTNRRRATKRDRFEEA